MKALVLAMAVTSSTASPELQALHRCDIAYEGCLDDLEVCNAELAVARTAPPIVETRLEERLPDWVWPAIGIGGALVFGAGLYLGAQAAQ